MTDVPAARASGAPEATWAPEAAGTGLGNGHLKGAIALLPDAARATTAVVAAIDPQEWGRPSPCARWSVRDVLNHLAAEHLWAPHLLRGDSLAEVGGRYDGDVLGADPVGAWRRAMSGSLLAWAQADPAATVHTSMGLLCVQEYAHQMLLDLTVHGWDLAAGAGVAYAAVEDAVEDGIAYETPLVAAGAKASIFAAPTGYDGPNRLGVLLGLTGRKPFRRG